VCSLFVCKAATLSRVHPNTSSRPKVAGSSRACCLLIAFSSGDQGERDYGIDLTVECFDDGEPSGALLLLQLKGTAANPPGTGATTIPFDYRVTHLLRAERFATPVLLVWCPVSADEPCCWFLWLQSYIAVVLDRERPNWRSQETARLHIPIDNRLPDDDNYNRLRHIAGHPARTAAMGQLTRIVHETPFVFEDPAALRERFVEALGLDAIFGDQRWEWARNQRHILECGLRACELAIRGTDPTDEELREIGWHFETPRDLTGNDRFERLARTAQHCAQMLSSTVAVYFDDRLRHTVWIAEGDHDF
jgi:hypothetical protein